LARSWGAIIVHVHVRVVRFGNSPGQILHSHLKWYWRKSVRKLLSEATFKKLEGDDPNFGRVSVKTAVREVALAWLCAKLRWLKSHRDYLKLRLCEMKSDGWQMIEYLKHHAREYIDANSVMFRIRAGELNLNDSISKYMDNRLPGCQSCDFGLLENMNHFLKCNPKERDPPRLGWVEKWVELYSNPFVAEAIIELECLT